MVQFDADASNVAVVRNFGSSVVTFQRGASTFMTGESAKVADISVDVGPQVLTNVIVDSAPQLFVKLQFLSAEGRSFTDLKDCTDQSKFVQQIKFQCFVPAENKLFKASASFDTSTGDYLCIVEPAQTKVLDYTVEEALTLVIVASDSLASYQLKKLVPISYVSAFQLRPHHVELSPRSRRGKFQVFSTSTKSLVFAPALDPTQQCSIDTKQDKCDFGSVVVFQSSTASADSTFYEIYAKGDNFEEAILVRNALTGQQERVTFAIGSVVPVEEAVESDEVYVVLSDEEESESGFIPIIIVLLVIALSMYVILVCQRRVPEQGTQFIPIEVNESAFAPQVPDSTSRTPRRVVRTMNESLAASTAKRTRVGFTPMKSTLNTSALDTTGPNTTTF